MNRKHAGRALRVMITIAERKMPMWYKFLSAIQSGHVRAEVVRLHLQEPNPRILLKLIEDALPPQEPPQECADEQAIRPDPATAIQTEAPEVLEMPEVLSTPEIQEHPTQSEAESKMGLAQGLLLRGGDPTW